MAAEHSSLLLDWIQLVALLVGIGGGLLALFRGLYEMQASTRQRRADLRWKHANVAKELVTDIHRDSRSAAAVLMIDWREGTHEYEIGRGDFQTITYGDVLAALAKPQAECQSRTDHYIRDCFDWFFYYMDRIEHYIQTGLIDFVDVASVFKPYARAVREHRGVYETFVAGRGYELVPHFLQRFT